MQNAVSDTAKQLFAINGSIEGQPESGWIVIDIGDVVVHLFGPQQRDFYQLEKLWEQGKTLLVVQ
jgi:ribosome-associated protein